MNFSEIPEETVRPFRFIVWWLTSPSRSILLFRHMQRAQEIHWYFVEELDALALSTFLSVIHQVANFLFLT